MLKAEKAYEIYFFSDYISYYLKDNEMKKLFLDCRMRNSKKFSNEEEALDFIDKYLQKRHSTFIVFEDMDNLDMCGAFNMDSFLDKFEKGTAILLQKESIQLVKNDKSTINISDLPYDSSEEKKLEENFRDILMDERSFPFDKEENVSFYIGKK